MIVKILLFTTFGSILSLVGGVILLFKKNLSAQFSLVLTSFAAGVLLATAFLDLFPDAVEQLKNQTGAGGVFLPALSGIVLFFLFERTFIWFHHHHEDHGAKPTIWTIALGDGVHNFIDGVAISAAFLSNPGLGLITAIAVAAHEIPQEIADFSVLLAQGVSKTKTLLFNLGSALTAYVGAITMYLFSRQLEMYLGVIIAFTAGQFAYIALSDLIPELHHTPNRNDTLVQSLTFLGGIGIVIITKNFIHGV